MCRNIDSAIRLDTEENRLNLTVIQTLPALNAGGVERGTIDVASELVRRGHRSIVVSAGGQMLDELLATGSEHINLPIGKKSLTTLLLVKELRRIMQDYKANILHSRSRLPAWISYLAWKNLDETSRPHFVTSVHGPYSVNKYSKIMTRGEKVIAISEFVQNYIHENYTDIDMNNVVVIHRGIDASRFPYAYKPAQQWIQEWQQQNPQLDKRYVITLPARITRWKGQLDFIEIIAKLVQEKSNVHGIIAGGAESRQVPYLDELKAKVRSLSLDKHISFIGHRNDLREVMSISNLVMSLAREPEAFGRTALEALALGVPVVAYDHGGASEVLNRMFPQGLVKALDKDAVKLKVIQFKQKSPKVAEALPFPISAMLDATLKLYSELATQH